MNLGATEIFLILVIVLVLFGPSRLPGLGKSIGEAIRGFKKGINDDNVRDVTATDTKSEQLDKAGQTFSTNKEKDKTTT